MYVPFHKLNIDLPTGVFRVSVRLIETPFDLTYFVNLDRTQIPNHQDNLLALRHYS